MKTSIRKCVNYSKKNILGEHSGAYEDLLSIDTHLFLSVIYGVVQSRVLHIKIIILG